MRNPTSIVLDALAQSAATADTAPTLEPLLLGIRDVLAQDGVPIERVQLPLNRMSGFRHPTLGLMFATWSDDCGVEVDVLTHDRLDAFENNGHIGTPYAPILLGEANIVRKDLRQPDLSFPILENLRDRGFVNYLAVGLSVPTGATQPISLATRRPLENDDIKRILAWTPLFSLVVLGPGPPSAAPSFLNP